MATARRIKGIDCGGPAIAGIRRALMERFDEMQELRRDALKWKDPEGVHSMRVSSRRLRSALSDFMPYLNKRRLNPTLKKIRSIADALGQVRDQDVTISALEKLVSQTPPESARTLEELISARKDLRRTARQRLKKTLVKDRLKEVGSDLHLAVTAEAAQQKQTSEDSFIEVARAVISARINDLEKLSDSFYRPLEAKPLHDIRIAAKRLRYAIELFAGCCGSKILPFAHEAAHLQSALGKLHDCDVWIESFGREIVASKKLKRQEQTNTFVWLFNHFNALRNIHFQEAFLLWNAWEEGQSSNKLKEALHAERALFTPKE
jgi:CHAD domain-containing protein